MRRIIIFLVVLLVLTAGCSQPAEQKPSSESTATQTSPSANVVISGFSFNPRELTVAKGTSVIWTNKEPTKHSIISDDGKFESAVMAQGQSWSYTFNEAGTYTYHCGIHPGMTGNVVVEG